MFLIALVGLRELAPQLRDQLMVTMRDRALIEARAKGIDVEAALRHPFRQLLKPDVVVSAIAVSVMLLFYYTAVAFSVIYLTTVFTFTVKDANGLGNWTWGFNLIAVILIGVISDQLPGAQAVHGDRRGRGRGHGRGVPGAGRRPSELLQPGPDPRGAVVLHGHRLHAVDGQLHRDRRGPQPRADRHRAGHLGLDRPGDGLPLVPDHPGRDQLGQSAGQLRIHRVRVRDPVQERDRVRPEPTRRSSPPPRRTRPSWPTRRSSRPSWR